MKKRTVNTVTKEPGNYETIRAGIVDLLKAARAASVRSVNAVMTARYSEIGRRIVEQEQQGATRANEHGQNDGRARVGRWG